MYGYLKPTFNKQHDKSRIQCKTYQIWQQIYSSLNTCLQQTPPGISLDGKWIEILNNGSNVIDVSGWSITNGKGDLLYFDLGTMVFNQSSYRYN